MLPSLELSAAVKSEIADAVAASRTVSVPAANVVIDGWTGVGYTVDSGDAVDYRISGGAVWS